MKPFDESDLIAYHLRELPPRRARALEQALEADPFLAAEFETYATMLRSFKGCAPLDVDEEMVERNWMRLWSKLPRQPLRPSLSRWLIPALAGAALAFAATGAFITTHRHMAIPSSMHRSNDTAQSIPSAGNPLNTNASPDGRNLEQQGMRAEPLPPGLPRTPSPTVQRHNVSPRVIASVPPGMEPPSVLRLIPLAPVTVPLATVQDPPPIAIEPTTSSRLLGSNDPSKLIRQRNSVHHDHPIDVTLAMGGMLIGTRSVSSSGATHSQGATHAISAVGSFHQQLRPAIGYRVAVSYTRPDFLYDYRTAGTTGSQININGRIYELAGTYVIQGPHPGAVNTSVEGGAGLMAFLPSVKSSDTSHNLRGAAIVGVAADFPVTKRLAVHTGYRMQIFKGPDFHSSGNGVPIVTTTLISNEPMVGITYRFSNR